MYVFKDIVIVAADILELLPVVRIRVFRKGVVKHGTFGLVRLRRVFCFGFRDGGGGGFLDFSRYKRQNTLIASISVTVSHL